MQNGSSWLDGVIVSPDAVIEIITEKQTSDWAPDPSFGQATHGKKTSTQTSTATTAVIESVSLPDARVTSIYATVTAHQNVGTGSPDGAEFQLKAVWRRDGGAPVQVKAPTVIDSNLNANGTGWSAVLLLNGNNCDIRVTGDTGKTIKWRATRLSYEGD